jgi:hypothetical protein
MSQQKTKVPNVIGAELAQTFSDAVDTLDTLACLFESWHNETDMLDGKRLYLLLTPHINTLRQMDGALNDLYRNVEGASPRNRQEESESKLHEFVDEMLLKDPDGTGKYVEVSIRALHASYKKEVRGAA